MKKHCGSLYSAMFFSVLFFAYSNPCIVKEIVSNLPTQYLSVESLSICVSTLLIGMIWKGKTRDVVIRNFTIIATIETIASIVLAFWLLVIGYNVWVLAIASLIYINVISLFVNKCIMAFKSKLFLAKEREDFDNSSSTIHSIAAIIGYIAATFFMPSLEMAILIWSSACVFDDIGWIYIYIKNKGTFMSD